MDGKQPKPYPAAVPCEDHLGNAYPSKAAMLRAYGLHDTTFDYRIGSGMTLEEALTTPKRDTRHTNDSPCEDHLGNGFPSKRAMCDHWRIPRNTYFRRIRDGWSLERALTEPVVSTCPGRKIYDHEGNAFDSVDAMCARWDITKEQYMVNIRNGLDVGPALTSVTGIPSRPRDHLGNEYASINEMCRAYGTNKSALRSRIELGWTLRQILENPGRIRHGKPCTDGNGNRFETETEMRGLYGVSYATYSHRMRNMGLTPDEAVSAENLHVRPCRDHLGNGFRCTADMLAWWNSSNGIYASREDAGLAMKARLEDLTPGNKIWKRLGIKRRIGDYYLLPVGGVNQVMHSREIHAMLRKARLEEALYPGIELRHGWQWRMSSGGWHHIVNEDGRSLLVSGDDMFRLAFFSDYDVM